MYLNQAVKKGRELDILIYGIIGGGWWDDIDGREVQAELQAYGNDIDTINVRIHSPGGSIAEGCAIYNALRHHPAKKIVYIEGECSSIATVVAMAGDEIIMSPVSRMMIHDPLVMYTSGGAKDLRAKADVLDKLKEIIINAYVTKSRLPRETISDLMSKETHMTAEEALEKGFITKVEDVGSMMNYYINNFAGGEMNINTEKNKKTEEPKNITEVGNMSFRTKDEFKNQFPEMFQEIITEGVNIERNRMKRLDSCREKNLGAKVDEIINRAKYETFETMENIMDEVFNNIEKTTTVTSAATPNTTETAEKNELVDKFDKKRAEVNESNVGKVPGTDESNMDEKEDTEAKNILSSVINMVNED